MTKRNLFLAILLVTTTAAISIAAVLLWSRSRSQLSSAPQTSSAPVNSSAAVAQLKSHAPGATNEGIKVHGDWTIEIRNPDGKLVERREFKNLLGNLGANLLADFLSRSAKAGEWEIRFGADHGAATGTALGSRPCINGDTPADCLIVEPFSNRSGSTVFKTLTISSGTGNGNSRTTVLSGTATAQRDARISAVNTHLSSCPVEATGVCSSGFTPFTSKILGTSGPNVVAGQIIQVTVVISFS